MIHKCDIEYVEKKPTMQDLQGFWKIIYVNAIDNEQMFKELKNFALKKWKIEMEVTQTATTEMPKPQKMVANRPEAESILRL